jgi:hypothetical protein
MIECLLKGVGPIGSLSCLSNPSGINAKPKNDPQMSDPEMLKAGIKKMDPSSHKIAVVINRGPQYRLNKQNYI